MTEKNCTWIFDLDGTLIDSQAAILSSLRTAITSIAPDRLQMLASVKIGPPLKTIASQLLGQERITTNPLEVGQFIDTFKAIYDDAGVRQTLPYPGVNELLQELSRRNQRLIIATNKRAVPTRKLLALLGWVDYFSWVGCLDEANEPDLGKQSIIKTYVEKTGINSSNHVFIGDTVADAMVAEHFSMPFVHAAYGYEPVDAHWQGIACAGRIDSPLKLLNIKI